MKKILFSVAALFSIMLANAGDKTIVVKNQDKGLAIGATVVSSGNDTLTVVPSKDVETITITLKDVEGNVLYYNCVPASFDDHFTIISPELSDGFYLEVYDDKGRVYSEFKD